MRNTYLLFFGKSQDFLFYAFDCQSPVHDFDAIIKDFHELESKIFTVDTESKPNSEIVSKYLFNNNGKVFSLLKLYSMAQAYSGNRIDGSIYGVALLSESNIAISEQNLSVLKAAKGEFAKLSLENGVKFNKSNFYNDVKLIWNALVSHNEGNYFDKIDYNETVSFFRENTKAFWVNDVFKQPVELNSTVADTPRVYFSNDLDHLLRTQKRWGKDKFPIYHKENSNYVKYEEKRPSPFPPSPTPIPESEIVKLKFDNADLKKELEDKKEKIEKLELFAKNAKVKFIAASIACVVIGITALTFFFTSHFGNSHTNTESTEFPHQTGADSIDSSKNSETKVLPNETKHLTDILGNNDSRNTLLTLLQNIKKYPQVIKQDKEKYYNAIERDLKSLGLDPQLAEELIGERPSDERGELGSDPNLVVNNGGGRTQSKREQNSGKGRGEEQNNGAGTVKKDQDKGAKDNGAQGNGTGTVKKDQGNGAKDNGAQGNGTGKGEEQNNAEGTNNSLNSNNQVVLKK